MFDLTRPEADTPIRDNYQFTSCKFHANSGTFACMEQNHCLCLVSFKTSLGLHLYNTR